MSIIITMRSMHTIIIMKVVKWMNMASVLLCIIVVRLLISINLIVLYQPSGVVILFEQKESVISAIIVICLFLFEQAGVQKKLKEAGLWYATAPEEELIEVIRQEPGLLRDWDDKYGDRMQKIVFIGRHLDKEELIRELDECLE